MKIDRSKIVNRCGYDQVECLNLATKLSNCTEEELLAQLKEIKVWVYGKCELGLWADVLDRFDSILERSVYRVGKWNMRLDLPGNEQMVQDVVLILDFTAHLIEHSIYRYLYGSWNHVLALFGSSSLDVLLSVLGLAYNFSKRSNYFVRQDINMRRTFLERLYSVAETWGGAENGFDLASCCSGDHFPPSAGDVLFEYRSHASGDHAATNSPREIILLKVHLIKKSPSTIMEEILAEHKIPRSKQMALFSRIRLARFFGDISQRHKCIRARLQALSILCYTFDIEERYLYPALLEELVKVLSLSVDQFTDIKACVLRTMTALVNSTRLGVHWGALLESNGVSNYHGVLPSLTREWIQLLISSKISAPNGSSNQQYTTSLLSFLYHLACYEENNSNVRYPESFLNNSGVLDAMLQLISWHIPDNFLLSFVTRAVRVTDQILMSLSMPHKTATKVLMSRLEYEVALVVESNGQDLNNQRSGLMKSILNLLKRICLDTVWTENMRNIIEDEMPSLMSNIYSKPIFEGNSHLVLFAIETLTNYMYSAPSRLSIMQDRGITNDILNALVRNSLPQNRDFLIQLPVIINTLALNERGLRSVQESSIIDLYVETLISPAYLGTMKTKRNQRDFISSRSDTNGAIEPSGSAAINGVQHGTNFTVGQMSSAVYELIRSHNSLRDPFIKSVVKCLQKVIDDSSEIHASLVPEMDNANKVYFHDYIFNLCKFLEKLLISNASFISNICTSFLNAGGLESLCKLLTLPGLPYDFPVSAGCASLCNIFGHMANNLPFRSVIEPLFTGLSNCLDRLQDLRPSFLSTGSNLLKEYLNRTPDSIQKCSLHELIIAASYICIIVQIMENLKSNSCSNFVSQWLALDCSQKLAKLYSCVSFEATILLQLLSLDPALELQKMDLFHQVETVFDPLANPLCKTPLDEGMPSFVEALHIHTLIKKTAKVLDESEIKESKAYLAKRPNMVPAVRGISYVVAYVINSITELCTAWSHFCARGENSSSNSSIPPFSRRRFNPSGVESIPSEKRVIALNELAGIIGSFLNASTNSESIQEEQFSLSQRYLAIRFLNLLMHDATHKVQNITMLISLYKTNCIHFVFSLFDEIIHSAPTDASSYVMIKELLEELLLCAEKICDSYENLNDSNKFSKSFSLDQQNSEQNVQLKNLFSHEQLHSMLSPLAKLTTRSDLIVSLCFKIELFFKKRLSHRSVEIYLRCLINLLPKVSERPKMKNEAGRDVDLNHKSESEILKDMNALRENLFVTCREIAKQHPSNEILLQIIEVFMASCDCCQHATHLFMELASSIKKEEYVITPVQDCCQKSKGFQPIVEMQLVALMFVRMRFLSLRLASETRLPQLLTSITLTRVCKLKPPVNEIDTNALTVACLILNEYQRSCEALKLRKNVCRLYAQANEWYRYDEELPGNRLLGGSPNKSRYNLLAIPQSVNINKAFHLGHASVISNLPQDVPFSHNLAIMTSQIGQDVLVNTKKSILVMPKEQNEETDEDAFNSSETLNQPDYEKELCARDLGNSLSLEERKITLNLIIEFLKGYTEISDDSCTNEGLYPSVDLFESLLRLCLRLLYTDYQLAKFAAEETNILDLILTVPHPKNFAVKFSSVANTILKTLFEDKDCVTFVIRTILTQYQQESVKAGYRSKVNGCTLIEHPLTMTDLWRLLQTSAPLIARDSEAVSQVFKEEFRLMVTEEAISERKLKGQVLFVGPAKYMNSNENRENLHCKSSEEKPEVKPNTSPQGLKELSKLQKRIIDSILNSIKNLTHTNSKTLIRCTNTQSDKSASEPINSSLRLRTMVHSNSMEYVDSGVSSSLQNSSDLTPETSSSLSVNINAPSNTISSTSSLMALPQTGSTTFSRLDGLNLLIELCAWFQPVADYVIRYKFPNGGGTLLRFVFEHLLCHVNTVELASLLLETLFTVLPFWFHNAFLEEFQASIQRLMTINGQTEGFNLRIKAHMMVMMRLILNPNISSSFEKKILEMQLTGKMAKLISIVDINSADAHAALLNIVTTLDALLTSSIDSDQANYLTRGPRPPLTRSNAELPSRDVRAAIIRHSLGQQDSSRNILHNYRRSIRRMQTSNRFNENLATVNNMLQMVLPETAEVSNIRLMQLRAGIAGLRRRPNWAFGSSDQEIVEINTVDHVDDRMPINEQHLNVTEHPDDEFIEDEDDGNEDEPDEGEEDENIDGQDDVENIDEESGRNMISLNIAAALDANNPSDINEDEGSAGQSQASSDQDDMDHNTNTQENEARVEFEDEFQIASPSRWVRETSTTVPPGSSVATVHVFASSGTGNRSDQSLSRPFHTIARMEININPDSEVDLHNLVQNSTADDEDDEDLDHSTHSDAVEDHNDIHNEMDEEDEDEEEPDEDEDTGDEDDEVDEDDEAEAQDDAVNERVMELLVTPTSDDESDSDNIAADRSIRHSTDPNLPNDPAIMDFDRIPSSSPNNTTARRVNRLDDAFLNIFDRRDQILRLANSITSSPIIERRLPGGGQQIILVDRNASGDQTFHRDEQALSRMPDSLLPIYQRIFNHPLNLGPPRPTNGPSAITPSPATQPLTPLHPLLRPRSIRSKTIGYQEIPKFDQQSTSEQPDGEKRIELECLPLSGNSITSHESDLAFWQSLKNLPNDILNSIKPNPNHQLLMSATPSVFNSMCDTTQIIYGAELTDQILILWHDIFHHMRPQQIRDFKAILAQYEINCHEITKPSVEKIDEELNPSSHQVESDFTSVQPTESLIPEAASEQPPIEAEIIAEIPPPEPMQTDQEPPQAEQETSAPELPVPVAPILVPVTDEETIEAMREDGLDESFLHALPPEMRQEVLADFRRQRQMQARLQSQPLPSGLDTEFLISLPPNLQEEVLAQVRQEQAQNSHTTQEPPTSESQAVSLTTRNSPTDNAMFLSSLPAELRREILADMEDSQINVLPTELASEARTLRAATNAGVAASFLNNHLEPFTGGFHRNDAYRAPGDDLPSHDFHQARFRTEHTKAINMLLEQNPSLAGLIMPPTCVVDAENVSSSSSNVLSRSTRIYNSVMDQMFSRLANHYQQFQTEEQVSVNTNTWNEQLDGEAQGVIATSSMTKTYKTTNGSPNSGWDKEALTSLVSLLITSGINTGPNWLQNIVTTSNTNSSSINPHQNRRVLSVHLQRLMSNLCRYNRTRKWIQETILNILSKISERSDSTGQKNQGISTAELGKLSPSLANSIYQIGFEASLGCRVHVFDKSVDGLLSIHPKAADAVCGVLLDTFKEILDASLPCTICKFDNDQILDAPIDKAISGFHLAELDTDFWTLALSLASKGASTSSSALPPDPSSSWKMPPFRYLPSNYFFYVCNLLLKPLIKENPVHLEKLLGLLVKFMTSLLSSAANMKKVNESFSTPTESGETSETKPTTSGSQERETLDSSSSSEPTYLVKFFPRDILDFLCKLIGDANTNEKTRYLAIRVLNDFTKTNHDVRRLVLHILKHEVVTLATDLLNQLQQVEKSLLDTSNQEESIITDQNSLSSLPAHISPLLQDVYNSLYDLVHSEEARQHNTNPVNEPSTSTSGLQLAPHLITHDLLNALKPLLENNSDQTRFCLLVGLCVTFDAREEAFRQKSDSIPPWTHTLDVKLGKDPFEGAVEITNLWTRLSRVLHAFEDSPNKNAVALLDPLVESFCVSHLHQAYDGVVFKTRQSNPRSPPSTLRDAGSTSSNRYGWPHISQRINVRGPGGLVGRSSSRMNLTGLSDVFPALNLEAFNATTSSTQPMQVDNTSQQTQSDVANHTLLDHVHMDIADPMSPKLSIGGSVPEGSSAHHTLFGFAELHRASLNRILRLNADSLSESPYVVYLQHPRVLEFDIKRRFFRHRLNCFAFRQSLPNRYNDQTITVSRERIFEDSYARLHRKSAGDWKHKFIIRFLNEDGQDAGGLLREWYLLMSREIFNPNYCLFRVSPADRVTYSINPSSYINSNHLSYFKFVGRFIAKAIFDNKLLECYFTRSFYKHILGVPVKASDLESEDYDFYKGLEFLLKHNVSELDYDLTFSTEINEFGRFETRDLIENGRHVPVTEESKREYVRLVCQERMTGSIRQQLHAFLEGFYEIIPRHIIGIFNEQELELLISGLPNIDIEDLKLNTTYSKYQSTSPQIEWFWKALNSFEQEDRARFLQFITGTSKVPLGGFANLEGMHGPTKFQISRAAVSTTEHLPCAHTCFNTLELPAYESYEKLRERLLTAIRECSEGYGLA